MFVKNVNIFIDIVNASFSINYYNLINEKLHDLKFIFFSTNFLIIIDPIKFYFNKFYFQVMKSLVHTGLTLFIETFFLIFEFSKVMFWTVFYFIFSPTEKYVRNEIVLITGSARGLGNNHI